MSSRRLPGKALMKVNGEPLLGIVVRKLRTLPYSVVVLTSEDPSDDPIAAWSRGTYVMCVRGARSDVAARTLQGLDAHPCDAFFRVNADSPYLDPGLLQEAAARYSALTPPPDVVSNLLRRTYPYGIAVELLKATTFREAVADFRAEEREHITSYFYRRAHAYHVVSMEHVRDLTAYRYVVDTPEDFERLVRITRGSDDLLRCGVEALVERTGSDA